MIHTLEITYKIISKTMFNQIYKRLEENENKNWKAVGDDTYINKSFIEFGFNKILLSRKQVDPKYKRKLEFITIVLNPNKLVTGNRFNIIGIEEYEKLNEKFDEFIKDIHINLPSLAHWSMKRVDYTIDIETPYVKEYIKLFQRGDKPSNFNELYCPISKTSKQIDGSLYLFNKSVTINFYDKENEVLSKKIDANPCKNILRLEVQCKKSKTNYISIKNEFGNRFAKNFFDEQLSLNHIRYYYDKIIGSGDYYTLGEAIRIVEESKYTRKTKDKLIEVLKAVSKHRSIWKARENSTYNPNCFNRYLKQIRGLGVNPVTIPERWGIDKLENLIYVN